MHRPSSKDGMDYIRNTYLTNKNHLPVFYLIFSMCIFFEKLGDIIANMHSCGSMPIFLSKMISAGSW